MPVSIVIPARDAEATLAETVASLQAQTLTGWEAVLVDDGSGDGTLGLARALAAEDPRLRVIAGGAAGAGAARNRGLAEARHPLVLFLDADDLLRPSCLALLAAELERDPGLAGAHCGWARLAPDGSLAGELEATEAGDLFAAFVHQCLFPIHACLVRTELVRAVGAFDPGLVTCEDWDLWLRIARLGRPFAAVPDVLALYRMRERSASVDGRRMFLDGLEVLERARRPDPRVPDAASVHELGWRKGDLAATRLYHACWTAGLVLGAGGDARKLLRSLEPSWVTGGLAPEEVAHCLFVSALLPRCLTPERWPELWPGLEAHAVAFLAELETISGSEGLVERTVRSLDRRILGAGTGPGPARRGSLLALELDAARPVADVCAGPGIDRLLCRVVLQGRRLGVVELPVCDGLVPAAALADAVAAELAWPILGWWLERSVYPALTLEEGEGGTSVLRGSTPLGALPGGAGHAPATLHDAVGWTVLLQELFGLPDWPSGRFYDEDPELPAAGEARRRAIVELSEPLPQLVAPGDALDVLVTLGGAPLGAVRVAASGGRVPAGRLLTAAVSEAGFELVRACVREVMLGGSLRPGRTLRDMLAARAHARERRAGEPGEPGAELVLGRRRVYELGGAASRITSLPVEAADELLECAGRAGETVRGAARGARRARYDPAVLPPVPPEPHVSGNGSRPGGDYFDSLFAEAADPWDYTNPYEQTKYRQTLDLLPRRVERALELGCAEGHFTERLAERADTLVAADISRIALDRARERCGRLENVEYVQLDIGAGELAERFDLIVCSELLYYLADRAELDRVAAALARALRPGGRLVAAHAHVVSDQPGRPGFAWDVPFGARTIGAALRNAGGLELERELRTPFYRIQRFRRPSAWSRLRRRRPDVEVIPQPEPLPIPVAPTARWEGIGSPAVAGATRELPILMYHRVGSEGPSALHRYRLAPERLDEQLAYLREEGFRSVGFEEAGRALRSRRALPGRAVMLTFDDGCRDFLTEAWPLLRAHGFGAALFVVTDRVGGTSDWDARYGEPAELLDWNELRRLVRAGVEIGSHTATHPRLSSLSPADVAREAARSRAAIIRELGVEPVAIAYPYGDVDGAVRRIAGGAGYAYGVTTEGRRAELHDDPLALPRIEVTDTFSAADLIGALGLQR